MCKKNIWESLYSRIQVTLVQLDYFLTCVTNHKCWLQFLCLIFSLIFYIYLFILKFYFENLTHEFCISISSMPFSNPTHVLPTATQIHNLVIIYYYYCYMSRKSAGLSSTLQGEWTRFYGVVSCSGIWLKTCKRGASFSTKLQINYTSMKGYTHRVMAQ